MINPSWFRDKLPFDVRNAWRELLIGKLALIDDHFIDTYLTLFTPDTLGKKIESSQADAAGNPDVAAPTPGTSPKGQCGTAPVKTVSLTLPT
jgi:hypothetical protein